MYKNGLQIIVRSHECVMDGVQNVEGTQLWTVFSCTDYGGRYMNGASFLLVKKNKEIVAKTLDPVKGLNEWTQVTNRNLIFHTQAAQEENDLRNRPVTPPRNFRR